MCPGSIPTDDVRYSGGGVIMSKNYEKVRLFYDAGLWTLGMTYNAVDRWITAAEYQEITGKKYEKK